MSLVDDILDRDHLNSTYPYPNNVISLISMNSNQEKMQGYKKILAIWTLLLGLVTFLICGLAAFGKLFYLELRGPSIIGCDGWMLLNYGSDDT